MPEAQQSSQSADTERGRVEAFLADTGLGLVSRTLPDYLQRQRWFGGKTQRITSARVRDVLPLDGNSAVLGSVEVNYSDGSEDVYQLPLAVADGEFADAVINSSPKAVIASRISAAGAQILYDAVVDENFRSDLLRATAARELPYVASRVALAEQSNTSILYDQAYILKLYRRLQAGENPDVEIARFLHEHTPFRGTPAYLGDLHNADGSTLAFLQTFVANDGDGWKWFKDKLSIAFENAASLPSMNTPDLHPSIRTTLDAAGLLGRRTAELHMALSTPTDDDAFAAEEFTDATLAVEADRLGSQVASALDSLSLHTEHVPAGLAEDATSLLEQRPVLIRYAERIPNLAASRCGQRIRIHGDYHLGQVLRADDDFLIVDFEGEPAKPLAERRRKQSPLRDVAGMLRSFSYVAYASLPDSGHEGAQRTLASEWARAASEAYLRAYREAMSSQENLLPQSEEAQILLRVFQVEKALYELQYELNNRPSWLGIPLGGLLLLLKEAA